MKSLPLLLLAAALAVTGCAKVQELDATSRNTGRSFFGIGPKAKQTGVTIAVDYAPKPVRAGNAKSMTVTVGIVNDSGRQITLSNETGQRIEILLREPTGRVLTRWSESRSFDTKLTSSLINPGERISFVEKVSTRELRSGANYVLEAFVPGTANLKAEVPFTAQ